MTRNGITCVEWSGPFFLRYDTVNRGKQERKTIYRVDHRGETVYVGCTTHRVPFRLYNHSRREYPFGLFLRETPAAELSVFLIEDADGSFEQALIESMRPRFNRAHVAERWSAMKIEQRAEVLRLRASGMTLRRIGEHFGVSRQAVHQMLARTA